jgi:hypothetical protein
VALPDVPVVEVALGDDVTFVRTNFVLSLVVPVVPVVPVAVCSARWTHPVTVILSVEL